MSDVISKSVNRVYTTKFQGETADHKVTLGQHVEVILSNGESLRFTLHNYEPAPMTTLLFVEGECSI